MTARPPALTLSGIDKKYRLWTTPASRLWVPLFYRLSGIVEWAAPWLARWLRARADIHLHHHQALSGVSFTLQRGDQLLLCSDGLWSQVPEAAMVRLLKDHPLSDAVPAVVELALRHHAADSDNVTALGLEWEADVDDGVTTEDMLPGGYASTFQGAGADNVDNIPVDDLDDAAIERSIAEINDAIRRAAAKK